MPGAVIYVIFRAEAIFRAKISKERKVTYYIGLGMIVLGFILFISTFFEAAGFGGRLMRGNPFMEDPFTGELLRE